MCGILVGLNLGLSKEEFHTALETLSHRGPDEITAVHHGTLSLGHTRLSIIGLDNGSQPFNSDDHRIQVLVNGEIYNHREIRQELIAKNYRFNTESDNEVILHLYQDMGFDMLEKLRGEFACVIVDHNKNSIFSFRDRFGVKPLYYGSDNQGKLAIASEIKGVFAAKVLSPEIDPCAVRDIFSLVQSPSIFKNIRSVPPRSVLQFSLNCNTKHTPKVTPYWSINFPKQEEETPEIPLSELKKELLQKLEEAVSIRLQSDVPVGIYLSGGLDSTAVAALARKNCDTPIKAFSIRFSDNIKFDESETARRTAKDLGLIYHELDVTQRDMLSNLENYCWHTEYPCANFHGVGKYLLSKLAHKHVKVVLTGEGSDEIFLGYDVFRKDPDNYLKYGNLPDEEYNQTKNENNRKKKNQPHQKVIAKIKASIGHVPIEELKILLATPMQWFYSLLFSGQHRKALANQSVFCELEKRHEKIESEGREDLVQSQLYLINNLLENYILTNLGDRTEMAHSIEGRPPFLDHSLFDFVKTIPTKYKLTPTQSKVILREAVADIIPEEVYRGKKWPFLAPNYPLIPGSSTEMDYLIDNYMSRKSIVELGVFRPWSIKAIMITLRAFRWSPAINLQLTALLSMIMTTQITGITFKRRFKDS